MSMIDCPSMEDDLVPTVGENDPEYLKCRIKDLERLLERKDREMLTAQEKAFDLASRNAAKIIEAAIKTFIQELR